MKANVLPDELRQRLPEAWRDLDPVEVAKRLGDFIQKSERENKLKLYKPPAPLPGSGMPGVWPKQQEFHDLGFRYRERALFAINQVGKSYAAAAETAVHATGRYPSWWAGRRFDTRTVGWVVSMDWGFSKNNAQRLLMGETKEDWGTGLIPRDCILDYTTNNHAAADTLESVIVKNEFGGKSIIKFKSADVHPNKLGGDTIHYAWIDEEIPKDHYEEVLTRIGVYNGILYNTFTPLQGATDVCNRFLKERVEGSIYVRWTIDDDNLYTAEQRAAKKVQYANSRQRMARLYAIPQQGDGNVFSMPWESIKVKPFEIPGHWPRICGHDIGWTHPCSLNWLTFDRDTDTTYLYKTWRAPRATPGEIYEQWADHGGPRAGIWIPVSWPADGDNETAQGAGVSYMQGMRELGMFCLGEPAMLPETGAKGETDKGRKSVYAQVEMMDAQMQKGKFKVVETCKEFEDEYPMYHYKDGRIVKLGDDTICGTRYGWVMRRYAQTMNQRNDLYNALSRTSQNWRT